MRRRTLTLLATPAVLGAMTVAVPRSRGSRSSRPPTPPPRNASSPTSPTTACGSASCADHAAFVDCPDPLARAVFADSPGRPGKLGKQEPPGKPEPRGLQDLPEPPGPAGTARAYAVVQPTISHHRRRWPRQPRTSRASTVSKDRRLLLDAPPRPSTHAEETDCRLSEVSYSSAEPRGWWRSTPSTPTARRVSSRWTPSRWRAHRRATTRSRSSSPEP